MDRTLDDARRWVALGTQVLVTAGDLDEVVARGPSLLPDWTRKHILAHVAANAEALGHLVHWAATGEPTPMYSSPHQRATDIEAGSGLPAVELASWVRRSAETLDLAMDQLGHEQWRAEVVTAQGRTVPAATVPWLRAREVWVHAVDLDTGVGFGDLPPDFLVALRDDVADKRGMAADDPVLSAPLSELIAYLTGRTTGLTAPDGTTAATLGPWL